MAQPRYFRAYAESLAGEVGVCFYEVVNERVTRQLWRFGSQAYWAHAEGCKQSDHEFTDQPEWLDGAGALDLVECERSKFCREWSESGGPYVVGVLYDDEPFALYVMEDAEGTLAGTLRIDGIERASLRSRMANESEWYLDDDGERLAPGKLFAASPWRHVETGQSLLLRRLDQDTGEVLFNTSDGYEGEMFGWLRDPPRGDGC